jgi:hypothetical protein
MSVRKDPAGRGSLTLEHGHQWTAVLLSEETYARRGTQLNSRSQAREDHMTLRQTLLREHMQG